MEAQAVVDLEVGSHRLNYQHHIIKIPDRRRFA